MAVGFRMKIQGSEMDFGQRFSYVTRDLKERGIYEAASTELLKKNIRNTDLCVDVGAHIGYYTLIMAQVARGVIAFEPSPYNIKLLYKNISLNPYKNILVYEYAISDYAGDGKMKLNDECTGMNYLSNEGDRVDVTRIDYFAWKADVIKIDAEGYESQVLKGLGSLKPRIILVEDLPDIRQSRGFNPEEMYSLLKDYTYIKVDNNLFCTLK